MIDEHGRPPLPPDPCMRRLLTACGVVALVTCALSSTVGFSLGATARDNAIVNHTEQAVAELSRCVEDMEVHAAFGIAHRYQDEAMLDDLFGGPEWRETETVHYTSEGR